ncbi:MAG: aldo/keto reductase [Alistipes sp.]|nr:aldo/keto reductase [Alistipes sp.]
MEKKLGFGTMRLPLTDPDDASSIDIAAFSRMVDIFLERGFTYFDTAYTYHDGHCEAAVRKALVERYPRGAYSLTDKLPTMLIENEEQQESIFERQLENCGVEYFDRYLVHCATAAFCERAERLRSFDFVRRKKEEGKVRSVGFSFHDSPELLERLLDDYPFMDFVQLQISYMDWEDTPIRARECYEIARRHGKPVVVMCPLKGGMLADVPESVGRLFRAARPSDDPMLWALRFAASLDGVITVLSGMSSVEQMDENTARMRNFKPMDAEDYAVVGRAVELIRRSVPVQCTSCGYCVPVCPEHIPIFDLLHLYNSQTDAEIYGSGDLRPEYAVRSDGYGKASDCIGCRTCENSCPQHLAISEWMGRVADVFEHNRTAVNA